METLLKKLNGIIHTEEPIDYTSLVGDIKRVSGTRKAEHINCIIHGINDKIISVDKLFFKSIIMTETIEECDMIGLCIRFGANINRFYNDKNIIWYIIEKFKKRRESKNK